MTTTTSFTPSTVTITDGVTHTGDQELAFEAALTACVSQIIEDPEWTVQVVIAAILAEHELIRGVDPKRVRATLQTGLTAALLEG